MQPCILISIYHDIPPVQITDKRAFQTLSIIWYILCI